MTFWKWSAVALTMFLFVGCGDTTDTAEAPAETSGTESVDSTGGDTTDAAAEDVAEAEDVADAPSEEPADNAGSETVDAAEPEASPFVALPENADPRLASAYAQVTKAAASGEAGDLLNLAGISQQAASMVGRDDPKAAHPLFKQAAKALREAIPKYEGELPGSFVGPVFYNEACVLSQEGDVEGATASLEEAVTSGFSDFDLMQSDSDLEAVRAVAGFDEKVKAWQAAAIEKLTAHAKEELASGETFPFDFTLADLEGEERSLTDYKGKVVIVDIWGTWCPPCREEIPSFIKLQDALGDRGFQMIGLNYERGGSDEKNLKLATDYAKKEGINYPCLMGDEATREQVPDFRGFPTTLFIDKAGKVRMKAVGLHEYAFLEAVVNELLAEEAPAEDAAE